MSRPTLAMLHLILLIQTSILVDEKFDLFELGLRATLQDLTFLFGSA